MSLEVKVTIEDEEEALIVLKHISKIKYGSYSYGEKPRSNNIRLYRDDDETDYLVVDVRKKTIILYSMDRETDEWLSKQLKWENLVDILNNEYNFAISMSLTNELEEKL